VPEDAEMVMRSDAMEALSKRATEQQQALITEEAVKTALILPFIQALGYDIFDPTEVVPEFTADVGTKQGEKVDYAIMVDGEPAIVFECKRVTDSLDVKKVSQLLRYFNSTPAAIGVLTNGIVYKFFSDLDRENIMDTAPFLVIDVTKPDAKEFDELNRFAKDSFDPEDIKYSASVMKYIRGMKAYLRASYGQPDTEFIRLLAGQVLPSGTRFTQQRLDQFTELVKSAFHGFVADQINNMLRRAQEINVEPIEDESDADDGSEFVEISARPPTRRKNIETTVEEIEAYELVKVIVGSVVDPSRVAIRDRQTYCGVLFDDNNRKPICRLYFNDTSRKQIVIFAYNENDREETWHPLESIDEISNYASHLRATAFYYTHM
jgi:hypothetical protein